LIEMARAGVGRVDVVCPGFTSDCLETLEEINMEAREAFMHAGGKVFHYIPCLNDDRHWIGALSRITHQHLGGWPPQLPSDAGNAQRRTNALAGGAPEGKCPVRKSAKKAK
jgi:ferrochelatase